MNKSSKQPQFNSDKTLTFQGAIVTGPNLVYLQDELPIRPHFVLWANVETGQVYTDPDSLFSTDEDLHDDALKGLLTFIDELTGGAECSLRVQVRDPNLVRHLREALPLAVVEVREEMPDLDQAAADLVATLESEIGGPPSLLDTRGVTIERVRAFAEAAADFYGAAPWRYLTESDLIEVESPKPPATMGCLTVLGAGRTTYGLGFYKNRRAHDNLMEAAETAELDVGMAFGAAQVLFEPLDELPASDVELWTEHSLPLAGDRAYPLTIKYGRDGTPGRPSKKELTFIEGILRALANTSESEIDSGRWSKEVPTSDGPCTVTLRLPNLLDPPAPQDRMEGRLLDPQTADIDDLPSIDRLLAQGGLEQSTKQPGTAADQAQELCYQAYPATGRRRVQLARQALALNPDCADAYVILAEQSALAEDELANYQRGVEAGERTLGPQMFAEHAGEFWSIVESRPYMRARLGLAGALVQNDYTDEGIEHYQELLRLNPNDNQGVRYALLPLLMAAGRDLDAARLHKEFDESSAIWCYCEAVLAFRLNGRSETADGALHAAVQVNRHVPQVLASEELLPRPPLYAPGSYEEACIAAEDLEPVLEATPGVREWIIYESERHEQTLD